MAQARTAPSTHTLPRVQVIAPEHLGATAVEALRARGIEARIAAAPPEGRGRSGDARVEMAIAASGANDDLVVGWALASPPTPVTAVELVEACGRAAAAGKPICLLAPAPRGTDRTATERAAALAYLRAHGAAVVHDVDTWLEAIVLLVRFGLPAGPRVAVIAPPGSWLEAQMTALVAEADAHGTRAPFAGSDEPTDVVLYDPEVDSRSRTLPVLYVPVVARSELAGDAAALHGARGAYGAVTALGKTAERIAKGLGPALASASAELAIDEDRLGRQIAKLARDTGRLGDHETKVLLSAYGIPITRQAVATTPSAAVKLARRAGFPVELKPWGHDLPSEPAGCAVERNLTSDALVRHAFATVLAAAGKSGIDGAAVIVRETPPPGREVAVTLLELPPLGWTVVLDAPGAPRIAAPAPLRLIDAKTLAAHVVASRAGDPELDRDGLANVLRRASHLVVDQSGRLARLELPRVVVGGRGARTLVVDAFAELR